MSTNSKTTLATLGAVLALVVTAPAAQAKHRGSDDAVVERRHGADHAARRSGDRPARGREVELRHGGDDRARNRGSGRHADARHGADDGAGDDHGRDDDGADHD